MRLSIAAAAACLSIVGIAAADQAAASIKKFTDIPAQELGSALQTLAQDRDFQVVYLSDAVDRLRTSGAVGDFTADEALKKLLKGTGLSYRYLDEKTITVSPARGGAATSSKGNSGVRSKAEGDGAAAVYGLGDSGDSDGAKDKSLWDRFRLAQAATNSSSPSPGTGEGVRRADEDKNTISEIIVTAQKREERLQDVPVPVTVLNAQTLVENNALLLRDYYQSVPSLNLSPFVEGYVDLSIRGITTGCCSSTVGVMVDGVPFGGTTGLSSGVIPDIDPGDLTRLEVLRGPQGTLYGAASMGGLLNYVTKDPSTEEYSGRLQTGFSSIRNGAQLGYNVRASANVPVSDTLAIRVSGYDRQDPGYIDNPTFNVKGVNKAEAEGGRLSALWKPSEAFSLKLSALYQQYKVDGASDIVPAAGEFQENALYLPGYGGGTTTFQAYSAIIDAKLGWADLTSVSAYNVDNINDSWQSTLYNGGCALDGCGTPGFSGYGVSGAPLLNKNHTDKFAQEIRLTGSLWRNFDWLLGGYYTHENGELRQTLVAVVPTTGSIVGELYAGRYPSKFEERAAFADLTYHFTDRFDVQLGGRESHLDVDTLESVVSGVLYPSPAIQPRLVGKTDAFTYLLTPRFKLSPDLMLYARFASGYRPGGANTAVSVLYGAPTTFDSDKTKNYEIGLKGDFLDHSLDIDGSVYYIDWAALQVGLVTPPPNAYGYTVNGGGAKSEGVELSVTSRPLKGLTIVAWSSYDDAVLTRDSSYGQSGERLPNTSRWSGSLSVQQEFPLGNNFIGTVGASLNYVGDRVGAFGPPPRQIYPNYTKTDLTASVRYNTWTANLYLNNVADVRGQLNGGAGYYPPDGFLYIQPRTIGLNLSKTF